MAAACDSGDTCPHVFETERGTVVVQGYVVREADVPALAVPPAGESVVELPRDQFLEFARRVGQRPAPAEGALLHGFRHSAFRLETLQQYSVEAEAERFSAWLDRRPLPERSVQTSPWLRRMAETMPSGSATLPEMSMASSASSSVIGSACQIKGTTGRRERNE